MDPMCVSLPSNSSRTKKQLLAEGGEGQSAVHHHNAAVYTEGQCPTVARNDLSNPSRVRQASLVHRYIHFMSMIKDGERVSRFFSRNPASSYSTTPA